MREEQVHQPKGGGTGGWKGARSAGAEANYLGFYIESKESTEYLNLANPTFLSGPYKLHIRLHKKAPTKKVGFGRLR